MRDCETRFFGKYLHHFPYFGMRGPDDRLALENAFRESVEMFIVHFGVDPTAGDIAAPGLLVPEMSVREPRGRAGDVFRGSSHA